MRIRPGEKPNLLCYLAKGGGDPDEIRALARPDLAFIRARNDCADFRAAYFLRILYSFRGRLPEDLCGEIADTLLAFPYGDRGGHSMCTWTENHRLYLAGTEYLLARLYPERDFGEGADGSAARAARSAAAHEAHGRAELLRVTERIREEGFAEWGSCNYYPETLAALSNVYQFADDPALRDASYDCILLLLYQLLAQTVGNGGPVFAPACARAYVDNKVSAYHGNYLELQYGALAGRRFDDWKEKEGCFQLLLDAVGADGKPLLPLPPALTALIGAPRRETALDQGTELRGYRRRGLLRYSPENVRTAFEAGAVSDRRVIANSLRYAREYGLCDNEMLSGLRPLARPLLYRTGLIGLIKSFVPTVWDGMAMERGRTLTVCGRRFSVSAAFGYRVGKSAFQQNPLAVNLSHEISLFVTAPAKEAGRTGSPDYWIGGRELPRAAVCGTVGAVAGETDSASTVDSASGTSAVAAAVFGRPRVRRLTHLFFPTGLFDELDLSRLADGLLFGRAGGVNVCVRTNPGVRFVPAEESADADRSLRQDGKIPETAYRFEYDLLNDAKGAHFYLFEVDEEKTFSEFREAALSAPFRFGKVRRTLVFRDFRCPYRGPLTLGGRVYAPRFERPGEILARFKEDRHD